MHFQYAITASLIHKKMNSHPERISKLKPFINNYNWDNIQFPPNKKDYNRFEINNESTALNILHIQRNTENIKHSCKSKFNLTRKHQVILLMITDGKQWHYLAAVKKLSALLKKIK